MTRGAADQINPGETALIMLWSLKSNISVNCSAMRATRRFAFLAMQSTHPRRLPGQPWWASC